MKNWRKWDWGYVVKWLLAVGGFFTLEGVLVWMIVTHL